MGRRGYNPNSKYGRRKMREEAQYKYDTGSDEYKADIDRMKGNFWLIFIAIALVVCFIAYQIGGWGAVKDVIK